MSALVTWELAAVVLAIAYLLLAIRQQAACWPAAIASAAIYTVLMFRAGLYMESLLQLFYIGMAGYGWWHWLRGSTAGDGLAVVSWPPVFHVVPLLLIVVGAALTGTWLATYTPAAYPYVDSFTTWGAIVTTWMVARKVLQNWHYWFVIDSVSVWLFAQRGLWLTAALFVGYLVLILTGYRAWQRSRRESDEQFAI
jgi:nicotinamide mononucleotide transporter